MRKGEPVLAVSCGQHGVETDGPSEPLDSPVHPRLGEASPLLLLLAGLVLLGWPGGPLTVRVSVGLRSGAVWPGLSPGPRPEVRRGGEHQRGVWHGAAVRHGV